MTLEGAESREPEADEQPASAPETPEPASAPVSRLRVAIVVPTYNEAETLPELVNRVTALGIEGLGFVIVDDGSPDGTGELAERIGAAFDGEFIVLRREGKQGLGRAYVAGFQAALDGGAEIIVEMDADLSHPPAELPGMLAKLERADVVVGSRYVSGGGVDPRWSWHRKQISYWGNWGIRRVLGLKVRDATAGFKAFRRSALEQIGLDRLRLSGFGFQSEVGFRCQRAGLTVAEHPYIFRERYAGESKMSLMIVLEAFVRLMWLRLRG